MLDKFTAMLSECPKLILSGGIVLQDTLQF